MFQFKAVIEIIGVNPYVFLPEEILFKIFNQAGKTSGRIPVCGAINGKPYKQTLVKYSGQWRLYINTVMLRNSPKRIGEEVDITLKIDTESREIKVPEKFTTALGENITARLIFDGLPASRKNEIVRYLANIKTAETLEKNIRRAINFLLGKERFIGRDSP
jgi:hypothetical protein